MSVAFFRVTREWIFVSLFPSRCLSLCKYFVHENCLTCLITFCGTLTKHQIKGYFRAHFFAILHLNLLKTSLYQMADNCVKIKRWFCSLVACRFIFFFLELNGEALYVCLLTHRLTPTLWLPTEIKKSIFNHQKLIMRSRTWFYFLWGERGNVLLTTWGLVFSPKQKRGEITYFKPFSRHTCCDFGNHVYSLAHTTAPMQTFEIQFFRKREMSDVSSVGKCCLFYFTCIPVLPGRDTDINSGTVFHASLVKVCKPIPVSQETIGSQ